MPSDRKAVKPKKPGFNTGVSNVFQGAMPLFGSTTMPVVMTQMTQQVAVIPGAIQGILDKYSKLKYTSSDDEKALLWYVGRGDEKNVASFLKKNTETNIIDENGNTPLNVAVSKDFYSIFCMLLDKGADINVKDEENGTLLHIAIYNNAENIALKLLESQDDIHALDDDKNSAFSIAIGNKMAAMALKLLEKPGIETVIDEANVYGNTPFLLACATRQIDIALTLLSKGVKIDVANTAGDSPFSEACSSGLYDIVSKLVTEDKIDINQMNKNNETPLLRALDGGYTDIAKLLLNIPSCKVETVSVSNVTPLIVAVTKGFHEIVDLLLNKEDATFNDSLLLACEFGHHDVFDVISKRNKIDVACFNSRKNTPFLLAMSRCDEAMAMKLLEKGSDPTAKNEDNETALVLAIKATDSCCNGVNCISLISGYIRDKSIDINNPTVSGVSAVVCAINLDKKEILEVLLRDYISYINMSDPSGADGFCQLHYAAIPKEGNSNDKCGLLQLLFTETNAAILAKAMEMESKVGYTPIIYALCYGYKAFVDSAKALFGSEKTINFIMKGLAQHSNHGIAESVTKHFGSYSNIGNLDPLVDFIRNLALNKIVESNKDSSSQHTELMSLVALKSMTSYVKEEDISVRHHKESLIKCLTETESSAPWLSLTLCCIDNFLSSILEKENYEIEASVLSLLYEFIEKLSVDNDLVAIMMASNKYLSQFLNLLHYLVFRHTTTDDVSDNDLLRSLVKEFYRAFNPEKTDTIEQNLTKYEGNEAAYIKNLCAKYKCNIKDHFRSYVDRKLLYNDSGHGMLLDQQGFYCKRIYNTSITCTPSAKCSGCSGYTARNADGKVMTYDLNVGKFYCASTAFGCNASSQCKHCLEFQSNEVHKGESLSELLPYKRSPISSEQAVILERWNKLAFANIGDICKVLHVMFKISHGESLSKCAQLLSATYLHSGLTSVPSINELVAMMREKITNWDRDDTISIISSVTELSKHSTQFRDVAAKEFVGNVLNVINHFKFSDPDLSLVMVKYLLTQTFDESYIKQTCLLLATAVDSLPMRSLFEKVKPSAVETLECTAEVIYNMTHHLSREKALDVYNELNKVAPFISKLENYTSVSKTPSQSCQFGPTLSTLLSAQQVSEPLTTSSQVSPAQPTSTAFGASTQQTSSAGVNPFNVGMSPKISPFGNAPAGFGNGLNNFPAQQAANNGAFGNGLPTLPNGFGGFSSPAPALSVFGQQFSPQTISPPPLSFAGVSLPVPHQIPQAASPFKTSFGASPAQTQSPVIQQPAFGFTQQATFGGNALQAASTSPVLGQSSQTKFMAKLLDCLKQASLSSQAK